MAVDIPLGVGQLSVAVGDLDGDGKDDVVTATDSPSVLVLLGDGMGGFAAPVDFAVGSDPSSVTIDDFDGDGNADLAVANSSSDSVSVLLGDGAGGFAAAMDLPVGTAPFSVRSGDLDGDGDGDLAVANLESSNVSVLLGDGGGGFAPALNVDVGASPSGVSIGDLTGDGHAEVVVSSYEAGSISVLVRHEEEGFLSIEYPAGAFPISPALTDLNGDGRQDLIVANLESSVVSVLLGTPSTPVAAGAIADRAYLSGGASPGGTITFRAYGPDDATCAGPAAFTIPVSVADSAAATGDLPVPPGTWRFVADYPGDANHEAVSGACNDPGESVTVAGGGPPTLTTQASAAVTVGGSLSDTATLSDGASPTGTITFNLHGPDDAICAGTPAFTSTKSVTGNADYASDPFTANAPGTWRWVAAYSGDANNDSLTGACGDANESTDVAKASPTLTTQALGSVDGVTDVATLTGGLNPSGTITFNLYGPADPACTAAPVFTSTKAVTGNGGYQSDFFFPSVVGTYQFVASYSGDAVNAPVAGACNDPDESVTVAKARPRLTTVALGPGSAVPGFGSPETFVVGSRPISAASADFDDDGNQDLAVANLDSSSVSVLLGNGAGGFSPAVDYPAPSPSSVAVGDFDGDGKADLATASNDPASVSVLLGDGVGGFAAAVVVGDEPGSVTVGDLNGDGNSDLVVANPTANRISILLGDGAGGFAGAGAYEVGTEPLSMTVNDFDGDGKADLAVANSSSGTVSVLMGDGAGGFGTAVDLPVGNTPFAVGSGDLDADGDVDLAVANFVSDDVSLLLGDGAGGFAPASNVGVGDGPNGVAIGDLTGDGHPEVVASNWGAGSISVLVRHEPEGWASVEYRAGARAVSPVLADLNGDDLQDLAVANIESSTVSVLLGTPPTPVAAGAIADRAYLTGGLSPGGTVTYRAYGPDDATCAGPAAFTTTASVANGASSSGDLMAPPGTWRFVADYSGDANHEAVSGTCNDPGESVIVAGGATPTLTTQASAAVTVGGSLSDTATLAGGASPDGHHHLQPLRSRRRHLRGDPCVHLHQAGDRQRGRHVRPLHRHRPRDLALGGLLLGRRQQRRHVGDVRRRQRVDRGGQGQPHARDPGVGPGGRGRQPVRHRHPGRRRRPDRHDHLQPLRAVGRHLCGNPGLHLHQAGDGQRRLHLRPLHRHRPRHLALGGVLLG